ncbi:MAG: hypothetical protein Q8Q08_11510 [Candidatus Omnitrophota bacterium]|nr:hypothetical protein [Candidatus Omnitrophota bacterium]MDZ4243079.1 hypothetical protein [Candidatus Omnitrophota bacterium]
MSQPVQQPPVTDIRQKKKRQLRWIWTGIIVGSLLIVLAFLNTIKVFPKAEYVNPQFGISFTYPAYWKREDNHSSGALVLLNAPLQSAMDPFSESFNIVVHDYFGQTTTLSKFTKQVVDGMSSTMWKGMVKVLESKKTRLGGLPAHRLVFEMRTKELSVKTLQVWTVVGGQRVFFLTYMAAVKDFDNYKPEIDTILKTFQFR